jgi:predicted ester cyclase
VVNRWTSRGTHQGDLMGIPPTGKQVTLTGTYVARIVGGKIIEEWGNFDALGMMQQLGVVPSPGQAEG